MKQLYILPILLLLFAACNRDDSTGIIRSVSEITIEDETEELNVDFGFELIRKVPVSQTMPDLPLAYEWAAAPYTGETTTDTLKIVSEEEELHHTFRQRGKHRLRLKVSNEHEAVFKEYTVWVNAAFEGGIMLLAEDENGEGNLSFLKTLTPEEIEAGVKEKIVEHCFSKINPEVDMKNPIGFVKTAVDYGSSVAKFIMVMPDKVYFADPSTLELIGTTPIDGEYAGEKAHTFIAADYFGGFPFIRTENGKIIHVDKKYYFLHDNANIIFQNANAGLYEDMIVQPGIASGNAGIEITPLFLNYSTSTLTYSYFGYYLLESKQLLKNEDIITVFKENNSSYSSKLYAVTSLKGNKNELIIRNLGIDNNTWEFKEASKYSYTLALGDQCPAQGTQLVGCSTYGMALWHEGSEIYAWNYLNPEPKFPNKPVIDVKQADNAGTNIEITYMTTSNALQNYTPVNIDQWLYVGVYDKDTKRGSLYIYDCTKIGQPGLKPYKQFDNQTDRIKFITDKTR